MISQRKFCVVVELVFYAVALGLLLALASWVHS